MQPNNMQTSNTNYWIHTYNDYLKEFVDLDKIFDNGDKYFKVFVNYKKYSTNTEDKYIIQQEPVGIYNISKENDNSQFNTHIKYIKNSMTTHIEYIKNYIENHCNEVPLSIMNTELSLMQNKLKNKIISIEVKLYIHNQGVGNTYSISIKDIYKNIKYVDSHLLHFYSKKSAAIPYVISAYE